MSSIQQSKALWEARASQGGASSTTPGTSNAEKRKSVSDLAARFQQQSAPAPPPPVATRFTSTKPVAKSEPPKTEPEPPKVEPQKPHIEPEKPKPEPEAPAPAVVAPPAPQPEKPKSTPTAAGHLSGSALMDAVTQKLKEQNVPIKPAPSTTAPAEPPKSAISPKASDTLHQDDSSHSPPAVGLAKLRGSSVLKPSGFIPTGIADVPPTPPSTARDSHAPSTSTSSTIHPPALAKTNSTTDASAKPKFGFAGVPSAVPTTEKPSFVTHKHEPTTTPTPAPVSSAPKPSGVSSLAKQFSQPKETPAAPTVTAKPVATLTSAEKPAEAPKATTTSVPSAVHAPEQLVHTSSAGSTGSAAAPKKFGFSGVPTAVPTTEKPAFLTRRTGSIIGSSAPASTTTATSPAPQQSESTPAPPKPSAVIANVVLTPPAPAPAPSPPKESVVLTPPHSKESAQETKPSQPEKKETAASSPPPTTTPAVVVSAKKEETHSEPPKPSQPIQPPSVPKPVSIQTVPAPKPATSAPAPPAPTTEKSIDAEKPEEKEKESPAKPLTGVAARVFGGGRGIPMPGMMPMPGMAGRGAGIPLPGMGMPPKRPPVAEDTPREHQNLGSLTKTRARVGVDRRRSARRADLESLGELTNQLSGLGDS